MLIRKAAFVLLIVACLALETAGPFAQGKVPEKRKGPANPGLNSAIWNMTGRRERTPEEKKAVQEQLRRMQERGYGGGLDINYAQVPVQEGDYRVVLTMDGTSTSGTATILRDDRYQ
jgi:hypothetical protein